MDELLLMSRKNELNDLPIIHTNFIVVSVIVDQHPITLIQQNLQKKKRLKRPTYFSTETELLFNEIKLILEQV